MGVFYCTKAVLPHMIERKSGKIVNISSIAARQGVPGGSGYCSAKTGVLGLTRSLAMETTPSNSVLNVLKRTSKGEGTFPELAAALNSLEGMCLVIPPQEFVRLTEDLDAALERKGYGNVTVRDAGRAEVERRVWQALAELLSPTAERE